MPDIITGRKRPTKPKKQARAQKRKREDVNVEKLQEAVTKLDENASFTKFTDYPLSEPTKAGLQACHFTQLTDIQAKAIAKGLKGSDILGAAKTGSGKTLAFIIPVLENLYRQQCVGPEAGLGAMIISPTRELAIQIFDVLYKIGKHGHIFAAGLVIGGKSLKEEQDALTRMNIVVCTPGRMLQHLSQTAAFNVDNLQMLVLDEADRILDMGFQRDVDAIIEYLPPDRQTLLFSATQTKRVSDLARLSLTAPEYVSVHESAATPTPHTLTQTYALTPLPAKLDTLWSFLQAAKKSKLLVFLSSGKQVRFVYESFRRLQPGIPLLHLHGRQKQPARLEITARFSRAQHACLLSTDLAARGLDFPAVDWVVQLDAPEDADTYIHRVGRTARFSRAGQAVLFLDPSEEPGMLAALATKKIPIERIAVRAGKQRSIRDRLQGMCFADPELKYLGQKAFISYARSVHLQRDKGVFDLAAYALADFAASLGLPGAPQIKFVKGDAAAVKAAKNAPHRHRDGSPDTTSAAAEAEPSAPQQPRTKADRMFARVNQSVLTPHYTRLISSTAEDPSASSPTHANTNSPPSNPSASSSDEADDLLTIKSRHLPSPPPLTAPPTTPLHPTSRRQTRLLRTKTGSARLRASLHPSSQRTHTVFDASTGAPRPASPPFARDAHAATSAAERAAFVERERERLRRADVEDAAAARERRREKRRKLRRREEEEKEDGGWEDVGGEEGGPRAFEELADLYPSSSSSSDAEAAGGKGKGKGKGRGKGKRSGKREEVETLDEMEAVARSLLS